MELAFTCHGNPARFSLPHKEKCENIILPKQETMNISTISRFIQTKQHYLTQVKLQNHMLFSAVNVKMPLSLVLPQIIDISERCNVNNEVQVLHSLHVESGHRKFKLVTLYRHQSADFSPKIRKVEEAFNSQFVFFFKRFSRLLCHH